MDDILDEVCERNSGAASSIQAIEKGSVHKICSGQVVLTLASAVKELVENSIDAKATSIDVRLRDYGSESVEVVDNGLGVQKHEFQALTLKHHTSKLQDFAGLTAVNTFGFRGEALSSLCALSKLTIVTCHADSSAATRLEYDHNGFLIKETPCARQRGTTVLLEKLFSTLPVRHKEFLRNLRREFGRMVNILSAYGLVSTHLRLTCTNQLGNGKRNTVVTTNNNETIRENITNIFGPKQCQNLLQFNQELPSEEVCKEYGLKPDKLSLKVYCLSGYVSSSEHGSGRGSSDRQFLYINRRPCDLSKVSRVINEVYHMYNRHQYPFVMLNITLAKEYVDVNVTPDKRLIFLQEEKLLLAIIKSSLMHLFESRSSLYAVSQTSLSHPHSASASSSHSNSTNPQLRCSAVSSKGHTLTNALSSLKRNFSSAFAKETPLNPTDSGKCKQRKMDCFISSQLSSDSGVDICKKSRNTNDECDDSSTNILSSTTESSPNCSEETENSDNQSGAQQWGLQLSGIDGLDSVDKLEKKNSSPKMFDVTDKNKIISPLKSGSASNANLHEDSDVMELSVFPALDSCVSNVSDLEFVQGNQEHREAPTLMQHIHDGNAEPEFGVHKGAAARQETMLMCTLAILKQRLQHKNGKHKVRRARGFHAQIQPGDNQKAEEELKREIKKDMFSKMKIHGQFNFGFIIAQMGQDIFIIDQHASDEKYNFEILQRDTVIKSQKLIHPQKLELTIANEITLMDNLDIFQTNGFGFDIRQDAAPTQRIFLTSKPISKNWTFGEEDIEELIFMLTESPGVMCRPSRVRMMFASRACRKSIMIGTALNSTEMKKIVNHMGEIEQPWNCPHGRPTMRHLINLDLLPE